MISLETCDVLLCSGNGFLSRRIKKYNQFMGVTGFASEITHVALVAMAGLAVHESTTFNKWAGKKGVQMNPFQDWLKYYDGLIWARQFIDLPRPEEFEMAAANQMESVLGKPYESGIPGAVELLLCGIEWEWFRKRFDRKHRMSTKKLHCSENACLILQNLHIVKWNYNQEYVYANKMPPYEWAGDGKLDKVLNYKLTEPILIKR